MILAIFCEIGVFLRIIRGTMWHYPAVSKTLKKLMFAIFVKIDVFLKIVRGTIMVSAFSKTLKKLIFANFVK